MNRRLFVKTGVASFVALAVGTAKSNAAEYEEKEHKKHGEKIDESKILRAKDVSNLEGLEIKHVPMIAVEHLKGDAYKINIAIGKESHPQTDEHHIEWMKVFVNDEWRGTIHLPHTGIVPTASISVTAVSKSIVKVWSSCNKHGIWENKTEIA